MFRRKKKMMRERGDLNWKEVGGIIAMIIIAGLLIYTKGA
jgi:hypothetical protein